jgi:hypothetical protein
MGAPASSENTALGPNMTELGKASSVGNACPAKFSWMGIDRNRPGGGIGAPKFKLRSDCNAKGGGDDM